MIYIRNGRFNFKLMCFLTFLASFFLIDANIDPKIQKITLRETVDKKFHYISDFLY